MNNGKEACPHSVTLKESLLLNQLGIMINSKINSKDKTKSELAKVLSDFVNPRDIKTRQDQINKELLEVDNKIKELLDKGMLLVSRGVQDEGYLKEHLDEHYQKKRKLLAEIDDLELRLESLKEIKRSKILRTLEEMKTPIVEITQEEILLFIKGIVVGEKQIEITTTTGDIYNILIEKVQ